MRARALLVVALAACGGESNTGPGTGLDANNGCDVFITFDPQAPITGETVRATANFSGITGLPGFTWMVSHDEDGSSVAFMNAKADGSEIEFAGVTPGTYDVLVDLTMTSKLCPTATGKVNVVNDTTSGTPYRLRVVAAGAPPQEKLIKIPTGLPSFAFGGDDLSPGSLISGLVQSGTTPVPAYIKITPLPSPDEIVEAFSDATGAFSATVTNDAQTVLVIPASPALAPRTFATTFSTVQPEMFQVDPGSAIGGVVTGPSGAALAGAQIQISIAGVPSTLATTAADGSFTVRAATPGGAVDLSVDVTPPAATGLPRLAATGTFDPAQPFAIAYSAITTRDLAGVHVTRGGANLANAQVTLVGTLSNAGTLTVAGAMVTATGTIHVAATADASGALPSLVAPALGISAVVQSAPAFLAVVAVNLGSGVPATIAAAAAVATQPHVLDASAQPLAGIDVDAVPVGVLALAGAQPIRATSDAAGAVAFSLASGGTYDLRLADPKARVAPLVKSGVASGSVPSTLPMPAATIVSGGVEINGQGPAANAVVQLLCVSCGGVERTRPIVEVTTDGAGNYHYAVVDAP